MEQVWESGENNNAVFATLSTISSASGFWAIFYLSSALRLNFAVVVTLITACVHKPIRLRCVGPRVRVSAPPNEHRGALRSTPGSASSQPEPNATELPSSAPSRPKLIETQSYRPLSLCSEEDFATTPGYAPAGDLGHRAFANADTHQGAHRHDARLWTCRPPRLRPRRHGELLAGQKKLMKKPFAWVLKGRARNQTSAS